MYMLIALSSSICCLSSPSHLRMRLLNGQAKVRYCHNAVAMFHGVTEVPTGHTYVQTIGTRDRDTLPVGASVRTSTYYACLSACRCLHVLAQARPTMTCIALVYNREGFQLACDQPLLLRQERVPQSNQ